MGKFPYIKSFRIYTEKTPEEVYAVLKGETAVWGMGHFPLGEGAFVGEVGASNLFSGFLQESSSILRPEEQERTWKRY